jgi:hypothetical protein
MKKAIFSIFAVVAGVFFCLTPVWAQASEKLAQAATVMSQAPSSIQLRYLQTLSEIAVEKNSTIVFPLPIEFLKHFSQKTEGDAKP